jgi:hypothetical protein
MIGKSFETRPWDATGRFIGADDAGWCICCGICMDILRVLLNSWPQTFLQRSCFSGFILTFLRAIRATGLVSHIYPSARIWWVCVWENNREYE